MHCFIFATRLFPHPNSESAFPTALLPLKGKALIDYYIGDSIRQKEIIHTTLIVSESVQTLFHKHICVAFPDMPVSMISVHTPHDSQPDMSISNLLSVLDKQKTDDDILILSGTTYNSLQLNDFIRFYRQNKGVTTALYEGNDRVLASIPSYIIPCTKIPLMSSFLQETDNSSIESFILWIKKNGQIYSFDSGTGYLYDIKTEEVYKKVKLLRI